LKALVGTVREFRVTYPGVELCVQTETLSAASALVTQGTCDAGIVSEDADLQGLHFSHCSNVRLITVVAPEHPLVERASGKRRLTMEDLSDHVQIVLSERGPRRGHNGPDHAVLSPQTWRVADLETKRALLVGGVGWGNMPEHSVREDLRKKRLVRIRPATWNTRGISLALLVVRRPNATFGPAMSWLLSRLATQCEAEVKPAAT
jgi:DNA-binding transcriptional LysR family regulator